MQAAPCPALLALLEHRLLEPLLAMRQGQLEEQDQGEQEELLPCLSSPTPLPCLTVEQQQHGHSPSELLPKLQLD